jgi:hypothetical protein
MGDNRTYLGFDVEEARAHRLKLMDERTAEKARAHWESIHYHFCEHWLDLGVIVRNLLRAEGRQMTRSWYLS